MDKTKIVELLRSVPLFSDLGDHDLTQVADRMKEVHFSEGTSVATQGQSGVGFHLVVDGTAFYGLAPQAVRRTLFATPQTPRSAPAQSR